MMHSGPRITGTRATLLATLLAVLFAMAAGVPSAATPTPEASDDGRRTYTGTIEGAKYRVEMPEHWNGTLILFSHGYELPAYPTPGIQLTTAAETEELLLRDGYALAASEFQNGGVGYVIEAAFDDQLRLLDWFESKIGAPDRTLASGYSQGALISTLLSERRPHRFDGTLAQCSEFDSAGVWNTALDLNFVVRTLLAPGKDIEIVEAQNPERSTRKLSEAITRATKTREGRARLAFAGAIANLPTWYATHDPEPAGLRDRIIAQAKWTKNAYALGMGPSGRVDLEERAGGNPSWNVGVAYGNLLQRSRYDRLVRRAYRKSGVSLRDDLRALARAPRIKPDPRAVIYQYRHGVAAGTTPDPVVTLLSAGDSMAPQDRWYAKQVHKRGEPRNLRQLYVDRGGHCSFSAADEVTAIRTLQHRIDTGRWPNTSARRLNRLVAAFDPKYQKVLDIGGSFESKRMPPAFTRYTPPRWLRPSY